MNKLHDTEYLKTVVDADELEDSIAEVAFVGRSNVGKSSVINAVCGRKKLAYTSQIPGKTRTINVFSAARDKWIVDLPGYGFAVGPEEERAKWRNMIEGYLQSRGSLRMVFVIVDVKVGPTKLDRQMLTWLQSCSIPACIVANKSDKIKIPEQKERLRFVSEEMGISPEKIFLVSAEKGTGIPALANEVMALLEFHGHKGSQV
jgi:GTP-binding protein